MSRTLMLLLMGGSLMLFAGCRNTCNRHPLCHRDGCGSAPGKSVFVPPPAPAPLLPPPGTTNVPPPNMPPSNAFPIAPGNQPPTITPTPPPAPNQSKFEPQWQKLEARAPAPEQKPRVQLYAPEPIETEQGKKPTVRGAFPTIPQFAIAKDNAFAGLRPKLDGLDWLEQNGVKTVVNVRLFGEDDSADKTQVEKRGMRYVAFEVSPVVLSKEKADEFIKLIREGSKQGIFVYDQDGSLAGSMWYLYFRLGEFIDDDAAQLRSRPLGLDTNRDGQHREMWLAVQKLLSENNP